MVDAEGQDLLRPCKSLGSLSSIIEPQNLKTKSSRRVGFGFSVVDGFAQTDVMLDVRLLPLEEKGYACSTHRNCGTYSKF
jgi:hypothetical protein